MKADIWDLASALDVVPVPANSVLSVRLWNWWGESRQFGCRAAKTSQWFVVAPDVRIWCHSCAVGLHRQERRCVYCHQEVSPKETSILVHQMADTVTVLARTHDRCHEEAAR